MIYQSVDEARGRHSDGTSGADGGRQRRTFQYGARLVGATGKPPLVGEAPEEGTCGTPSLTSSSFACVLFQAVSC